MAMRANYQQHCSISC